MNETRYFSYYLSVVHEIVGRIRASRRFYTFFTFNFSFPRPIVLWSSISFTLATFPRTIRRTNRSDRNEYVRNVENGGVFFAYRKLNAWNYLHRFNIVVNRRRSADVFLSLRVFRTREYVCGGDAVRRLVHRLDWRCRRRPEERKKHVLPGRTQHTTDTIGGNTRTVSGNRRRPVVRSLFDGVITVFRPNELFRYSPDR